MCIYIYIYREREREYDTCASCDRKASHFQPRPGDARDTAAGLECLFVFICSLCPVLFVFAVFVHVLCLL